MELPRSVVLAAGAVGLGLGAAKAVLDELAGAERRLDAGAAPGPRPAGAGEANLAGRLDASRERLKAQRPPPD